jgi:hypothetical protein
MPTSLLNLLHHHPDLVKHKATTHPITSLTSPAALSVWSPIRSSSPLGEDLDPKHQEEQSFLLLLR